MLNIDGENNIMLLYMHAEYMVNVSFSEDFEHSRYAIISIV